MEAMRQEEVESEGAWKKDQGRASRGSASLSYLPHLLSSSSLLKWDHRTFASVQSIFSYTPSHLILTTTLKGRYPHQHLI